MIELSIEGLQKLQQANLRMLDALKPSGAMGRAIVSAGRLTHRYAVHSTPHDYGALRASHRVEPDLGNLRARIFIDPAATHPRSKTPPSEYGVYLHRQGMIPGLRSGIRAFYQYTVETYGPRIAQSAIAEFRRGLP